MRLKWTRRALQQLTEALDYIAEDDPDAARRIATRISEAISLLLETPGMGRPGRVPGTREWVVRDSPFFLVYEEDGDELLIFRVIHAKTNWPSSPER